MKYELQALLNMHEKKRIRYLISWTPNVIMCYVIVKTILTAIFGSKSVGSTFYTNIQWLSRFFLGGE